MDIYINWAQYFFTKCPTNNLPLDKRGKQQKKWTNDLLMVKIFLLMKRMHSLLDNQSPLDKRGKQQNQAKNDLLTGKIILVIKRTQSLLKMQMNTVSINQQFLRVASLIQKKHNYLRIQRKNTFEFGNHKTGYFSF